ncbi:hypothetical protein FACS1894158_17860 [Betaproteobacteria bacterium]|nr:hypothetical protein FACS1894158_17860 [Betaproteobacteria bacterium]
MVSGALSVTSGANGTDGSGAAGAAAQGKGGAGGKASFTAGILSAPTINLTKNDGALNFAVDNLDIRSTADTTLTANGNFVAGDTASIGVLWLLGDKNFIVTGSAASAVTVGQLIIVGGTLNSGNWSGIIERTYTDSPDIGIISGGVTVDLNTGEDKTLSRNLGYFGADTGGLTKTGAGTLTLSGTNTYDGGTSVNGGLINFSNANNFGTGAITLNGGGLQWASGTTTDISSRFDTTSALGAGGGILDTNANEVTLNSAINGSGRLTKTGLGTLALAGTNTYTGGTTVSGGTLSIAASTNIGLVGNGINEINGGTLKLTGTDEDYTHAWTLTGPGNNIETANPNTISGILSGTGGFTKSGGGILTLSNANNYGGATTINAGTLALSGNGSIADSSGLTLADVNGALFDISGASGNTTIKSLSGGGANGGDVRLDTKSLTVQSGNFGGNISGTGGSLTKEGAGTLTLTGNNTYDGGTTINAGTLALSGNGSIAASSGLTLADVNGALFDISGASGDTTIKALNGGGTNGGNVRLDTNSLTVQSGAFSGGISGAGLLTKEGPEKLILSGDNSSHSGGTTVNGGTLSISADKNIGSGINTLNGATLQLTGTSGTVYTKAWTLGGSAIIEQNDASALAILDGVLSGTGGSLTKTGAGTLILTADNSYTGGTTINTGTLQIGNGGTTGRVDGNIVNNANLVFNRSDAFTHTVLVEMTSAGASEV